MVDLTPGEKRWTVVFGDYAGVEQYALVELQRAVQHLVPYVLPVVAAGAADPAHCEHVLLLGTRFTNRWIAELEATGAIPAPPGPQGYTLWIGPSPWGTDNRLIVLDGADAAGALYAVQELLAMVSADSIPMDKPVKRRNALAQMPDTVCCEAPAVPVRGLWTWGYVVYDYRRFLDQMVRLKMNMLTLWNSEAPLNLPEILREAHRRGIQIIAGFNWGWGHDNLDLSRAEDRAYIKQMVLDVYTREYAGTGIDGIYFQTLTEHTTQEMAGRSVAAWCVDLVNDIAGELYARQPDLSIQFGLHATSIREHFTDLEALDPRMLITWEDAGALPFSYSPNPEGYEETLDYAKRLAAFRPGTPFALVPKGWTCLRWDDEFAKHGPFLLGEREPDYLRERLYARQHEWDAVNQAWLRLFPLAARFYRETAAVNPNMLVTGLVEDGLFEARIQPSVALLGEMLWNPHQADDALLARAFRPYVNWTSV
jgi:hypothetical protein